MKAMCFRLYNGCKGEHQRHRRHRRCEARECANSPARKVQRQHHDQALLGSNLRIVRCRLNGQFTFLRCEAAGKGETAQPPPTSNEVTLFRLGRSTGWLRRSELLSLRWLSMSVDWQSRNSLKDSPKVRQKMYKVTSNQKEQLLNQLLDALSNMQSNNVNNDRRFLLSMYVNAQNLKQGQSLSVKDAFKLKRLLKSATSQKYRPCPTRAGLIESEVATNPTLGAPRRLGKPLYKTMVWRSAKAVCKRIRLNL